MSLEIWDKLKQPPVTALKTIKAGRLSGMTDVNPQWRYQAMTEQFGPCGIGWKYAVTRLWSEPGSDGQIFAFSEVELCYLDNGVWSDPVPGIGGSMLVTKEKTGLHSSDEGYKMATTDALSVAMKMLGVAADIYAGRWDGSKYKDAPKDGPPPEPPPDKPLSLEQGKAILELASRNSNLSPEDARTVIDWYCLENGRTYHSGKELITEWDKIYERFLDHLEKCGSEIKS